MIEDLPLNNILGNNYFLTAFMKHNDVKKNYHSRTIDDVSTISSEQQIPQDAIPDMSGVGHNTRPAAGIRIKQTGGARLALLAVGVSSCYRLPYCRSDVNCYDGPLFVGESNMTRY
jgi:hypothetical protein